MISNRQISRLAKILVEKEGILFPEAETRLKSLTLEIVVDQSATSAAAHTSILTAVNIGHRSFVGGVKVTGAVTQPVNTALPLKGQTLEDAAREIGASVFDEPALRRIVVGAPREDANDRSVLLWWDGWRAGAAAEGDVMCGNADNPLAGIAAAALGVGIAFLAECGIDDQNRLEITLWEEGEEPPFEQVFLPGALWLVGIGNLGQAYLWALASLPYSVPSEVELVLQDRDQVAEENWGTSVLVFEETYGVLKTKIGERWGEAKGFTIRRVDRKLVATDRLDDDDPRVAVSGLDRVIPRMAMGQVGFECIVDAGLGRTVQDFDRFRVSVFDNANPIDRRFAPEADEPLDKTIQAQAAYQELEARIGPCGMAEIAGASAAVPFVSALASAIVVARLIALASGKKYAATEVGKVSRLGVRRKSPAALAAVRGIKHAGRPDQKPC